MPQRVYTSPPLSFQAVSEHDEAADESHRPNRRRRPHTAEATLPPTLELVETQAAAPPVGMESESPRRTKPRRRRGSQSENGPLQLVETQASADAAKADNPPTP